MTGEPDNSPGGISRRALLGTVAGVGAGATSGCLAQLGGLLQGGSEQFSLTVSTVPADADTVSTRIARRLVANLNAVGADAKIELQPPRELKRDVLFNSSFDIYIDRYPERYDPDFLRPLLHSVFSGEGGWQNPFGFTDMDTDSLLEAQRDAAGTQRQTDVTELQREVVGKQPFGPIVFPDEIWASRNDRFVGWDRYPLTNPLSYIALENQEGGTEREDQLRVTTTDPAPTQNLNPLAAPQRSRDMFTGLLYDPLGRRIDGMVTPWLAEEWSWEDQGVDAVGELQLRPDLRWHDGEPLTAADVEFTYQLLQDTLLGTGETSAPPLRFRGRASLVDSITAHDEQTVIIRCSDTSSEVADRALTVPILPSHIWTERAVETSVAWANGERTITEAMAWPNQRPVGSGVVQFDGRAAEESLVLTRYDDHFLHREPTESLPDTFGGGVAFDRLAVRIVPSGQAAVQLMSADEADGTAMRLSPGTVPRVGQDTSLSLHVEPSQSFYHIGFNTRREPLGNPHIRRAIVRLLDKADIAQNVFDGYAQPAASPLARTDWLAPSLEWNGVDPEVPFAGEEGELYEYQAEEIFRDAGLEYSDEGRLLSK